jgi:hypothetical protein
MNDEPIDFSELNPTADSQRFEHAVRRITDAAAPILDARRLRGSIWWQLTAWRRPVFAVGIATALLMLGVMQFGATAEVSEAAGDDLAFALGVPEPLTGWVVNDTIPATAQVLFPGEGE